jgi:acetoin utilization deacetylase AcuC-like enzyme
VNVYFDEIFLKHDTGMHPESAERFSLILDYLKRTKKPQNGEKFLGLAHTNEYIDYVKVVSERESFLDGDTPLSKESYDAACYAVGAAVDASENNGFALVRPPGHHAFTDHGSGFCIFNNMAIAALKASKEKKVFILDIDVHHGNGTEEIILNKKNIEFLSMHQINMYPGSGFEDRGKNCFNVPFLAGMGDEEYIKALEEKVAPKIAKFDPDLIGVSVGFDAYYLDQGFVAGNSLSLTNKTYEKVRELLKPYDVFYTLEGGYNPKSILEGSKALLGL